MFHMEPPCFGQNAMFHIKHTLHSVFFLNTFSLLPFQQDTFKAKKNVMEQTTKEKRLSKAQKRGF